jgi:hypothetical protein
LTVEKTWENRSGFEKTRLRPPQTKSTTRNNKLDSDGQNGNGLDGDMLELDDD